MSDTPDRIRPGTDEEEGVEHGERRNEYESVSLCLENNEEN